MVEPALVQLGNKVVLFLRRCVALTLGYITLTTLWMPSERRRARVGGRRQRWVKRPRDPG